MSAAGYLRLPRTRRSADASRSVGSVSDRHDDLGRRRSARRRGPVSSSDPSTRCARDPAPAERRVVVEEPDDAHARRLACLAGEAAAEPSGADDQDARRSPSARPPSPRIDPAPGSRAASRRRGALRRSRRGRRPTTGSPASPAATTTIAHETTRGERARDGDDELVGRRRVPPDPAVDAPERRSRGSAFRARPAARRGTPRAATALPSPSTMM